MGDRPGPYRVSPSIPGRVGTSNREVVFVLGGFEVHVGDATGRGQGGWRGWHPGRVSQRGDASGVRSPLRSGPKAGPKRMFRNSQQY